MSIKEIHTIKRKFITISTVSFTLVILFIGALINFSTYIIQQVEIQYSLSEILDKKRDIEDDISQLSIFPDELSIFELFSPSYQRNSFYIFTYDNAGREISFTASRGNPYSYEYVESVANAIMDTNRVSGQHGMYFYQKETRSNGLTELAILDCTYVIYSRERLLYASIGVGIVGILASFILVLLFSNKAIQPEIRNNRNQMQFLTNISHELKTPLAVILSNAEMEEIVNGENEFTKSTIRQVNRMNGLIKSLVMITKTKEKADSKDIINVNISSIAEETLQEFSAMASGENKSLDKEIEPDLTVKADESSIRQLVMILVDNAIKYCDDGGTVKVSVTKMKMARRNVRLVVTNNYADGENIDTSLFFDRFYREDKSRNIDTQGYGIGLSIAENICEKFNGDISADWKDGVISFTCDLM